MSAAGVVLADDPVVVVGMGVEAPGGVTTPAELWDVLVTGRDVLGPLPTDRGWDLELLAGLGERDGWGPVPDSGGFLESAAMFDPAFFGLSPREAVAMDPQQRVALRVAWRALESAGIDPADAAGPGTGCFMGALSTEYGPPMSSVNEHSGYLLSGATLSALAGRLSHCLDATGPSMTVDTGCAASLSALHLAVNALRLDECALALAGGVTVMGSEMLFVEFARAGALAPGGHCRPYSRHPTGTVWSEGAGVVVLERASRARVHGHRVHGRLLAVTTGHNGAGAAIAVPAEDGQRRLVTRALESACVEAGSVGLVEGHGTGTAAGDPAELAALAATYGAGAARRGRRVPVGSLKGNFGHTQAAAGVLGLVKTLLCGRWERIVPTLHGNRPAAAVQRPGSGLALPDAVVAWEPVDGVRRAAVSAFGIGGSNTHVLLEVPPSAGSAS